MKNQHHYPQRDSTIANEQDMAAAQRVPDACLAKLKLRRKAESELMRRVCRSGDPLGTRLTADADSVDELRQLL